VNIDAFIEQEMYRFSVAFEVRDGTNTTWRNADLDNDPEYGNYYVFNHTTGRHEPFEKLSEAKARREELINEFRDQLKEMQAASTPSTIPTETL
jgi:hypothetical protein